MKMYRQQLKADRCHRNDTNDTISENDTKVLELIQEILAITQTELKEKLQVSLVTVKRLMADLQRRDIIKRQGSNRKGRWIIQEKIV